MAYLTGYNPDPRIYGTNVPNMYGDEASQRAAQQGPGYNQSTNVGAPTFDQTIGGQRVTTYDPNANLDSVMRQLRATSDMRNTGVKEGGITQAPDNAQYWAALHPNATPDQIAEQARLNHRWDLDATPDGKKGYRGWMLNNGKYVAMAALAAITAGGAAGALGAAGAGGAGSGASGGAAGSAAGGASSAGGAAASGATGGGLGIFSNGGAAGLGSVGGGNAGALAASGGIQGGAGTGILGSIGGGGLLSQGSGLSRLLGGSGSNLLGGGQQSSSPQIPYGSLPNLSGMLGSQTPIQPAPTFVGLPTQSQMPYIPAHGYNAHKFQGATVWT